MDYKYSDKKIVATHFTEFGELQFFDAPKPHFVFFNAKAKKKDITCYLSTIKTLGNALHLSLSKPEIGSNLKTTRNLLYSWKNSDKWKRQTFRRTPAQMSSTGKN